MDRLKAQYGEEIEFIMLDVDNPATRSMRERYDIVAQSQYVLANAAGEPQQKWFGYLQESEVAGAFDTILG